MGVDAMISLQCSSTEKIAKELNEYLHSRGFSTWICIEMQGGINYREEIVINASGSKAMIALMNVKWAESKECRFEFNVALRTSLTKGSPVIIPVILENFDWNAYPLLIGIMANTNGIFFNTSSPEATWQAVVNSLISSGISPAGEQPVSAPSIPEKFAAVSPDKENAPTLPENISEWNSTNVAQWIKTLDLRPAPSETFLHNWVDGPILLEITHQDLVESLKFTGLQAKRMLREIESRKKQAKKQIEVKIADKPQPSVRLDKPQPSVHSGKGFKTGVWEGYYQYPDKNGKKGAQDPMAMDVTMVAGVVAGYGSDKVGDFLIQGLYDDNTLEVSWDKQYVGKHVITYSGKLVDATTITGKWVLKRDGSDWGGPFKLTAK